MGAGAQVILALAPGTWGYSPTCPILCLMDWYLLREIAMDPFDPDNLRMEPLERPAKRSTTRAPRHKPGEWFIKGPIPGGWLRRAVQHPTSARVAWVLWYLAGRNKSREVVPTHADYRRFGLSRYIGAHGLDVLEQAGLVRVRRHRGRCPVVTLLDVEPEV